jgi:hypothetical protein
MRTRLGSSGQTLGAGGFSLGWWLLLLLACVRPEGASAACEKASSLKELAADVELARQSYFLAEFWQSLEHLKGVEARLACLGSVLPAGDLRAIYALKGTVLLNVNQPEEARKALSRAAIVSPSMDWDPELGSRGKTLFLEVKAAQLGKEPGALLLAWRGGDGYELAVDGKQQATGKTLDGLYPGEHFVQSRKGGGAWTGAWVGFPENPPWVPALSDKGEVLVQKASGDGKFGALKSHIHWKPGLYIAGGALVAALGTSAVGVISSSQAAAVLDSLAADEPLPDTYDVYATRANISAIASASCAGVAVVSTALAFFLPEKKSQSAQLWLAPTQINGEPGAMVALQIRW